MSRPEAILFTNGNALFFNEDGEQIPEIQQKGWMGVHEWRRDYPDAKVKVADWRDKMAIEIREQAIAQIQHPPKVDDE